MKIINQKGVSLLLTILIMAAILAISFGLFRLSIGEIKLIRDIPNSLIAYYAADAGIEWAIYEERQRGGVSDKPDCSVDLGNGSKYGIEVNRTGETITIKSIGCYKEIRRAIEVSF